MNKRILAIVASSVVLGLSACSSTGTIASNSSQPISDQRLATSDFTRQGVKVIYTLGGDIEAIEVTGYAPVFGNSQNAAHQAFRVAELEAKKSLNDFINKETVASAVSVKMISDNLEQASDKKSSRSNPAPTTQGNTGTAEDLVATDAEATQQIAGGDTVDNSTERNNALKIASRVSTTITNSNRGIIGGLYLKQGTVTNDGQNVQVVMRWDKKHNATRVEVRNLMAM